MRLSLGFHYDWLEHDWGRLSEGMMTRMRRERRVNTDEYRELLVTLATLLKQPQMQSLDIDNCPSAEAYQLIDAFLCTSTSIEQKLTIRVVEETKKEKDSEDDLENTSEEDEDEEEKEDESSKAEISDVMKSLMPPFSQPIPESSVKYKCLYMNSTGSSNAWLMNLPELKAKRLKLCANYLSLVSPHIDVQVEHIIFCFYTLVTYHKPTILPNHLESFIVSNQALKTVQILNPCGPSVPDIYPALNHCLSSICRQGRRLEKIYMNNVRFYNDNPKEFLTIVRDLSHQCGTTLVLSPAGNVRAFLERK